MYSSFFGSSFIECLEQVVENKNVLLNTWFVKILGKAADEWCDLASKVNGGNDYRYNLHRAGSRIDAINARCNNLFDHNGNLINIDWQSLLDDVRYMSEIIRHEMIYNFTFTDPRDNKYKKCGS